jgi:HPt (histidine-containing phosphotransfer) domain-containing protein
MTNTLQQERWALSGVLMEFAAEGEFDLIQEILNVFLHDAQEKVESLQAAVLTLDLSGAQRIAHSLKGASRQLDIPRLADDAERLERSSTEIDAVVFASLVQAIVERWCVTKQSIIHMRDSFQSPHSQNLSSRCSQR